MKDGGEGGDRRVCFCLVVGGGGGEARGTTLTAHLLPVLYLSYGSSRVNVNNEYV